jgi:hypothetical protein
MEESSRDPIICAMIDGKQEIAKTINGRHFEPAFHGLGHFTQGLNRSDCRHDTIIAGIK